MHAPHCTCSECASRGNASLGTGLAFEVTDRPPVVDLGVHDAALPGATIGDQIVEAARTTHDIANAEAIGRELIDLLRDNRRQFDIISKARGDLGRNYTRWAELICAIGGTSAEMLF